MKILTVVSARPNFVKISPLLREISLHSNIEHILIHTGQHFESNMNDVFFKLFNIPKANYELEISGGTPSNQIGRIITKAEKIFLDEKPDWVVAVGDVNSTVATSILARNLNLRLAHLEAGLRSFDETMPEEINRIITDRLSYLLFAPDKFAVKNLKTEGIDESKIKFVGNIMIDTLDMMKEEAMKINSLADYNLSEKTYALVTLHRPSNVDNPSRLRSLLNALTNTAKQYGLKMLFPMHPRTKENLGIDGIKAIESQKEWIISKPLDYLESLSLLLRSRLVITDSGGLQEETCVTGIPCVTVRSNTERPITLVENGGTNRLAKTIEEIPEIIKKSLNSESVPFRPELWDGRTAKRIIKLLNEQR